MHHSAMNTYCWWPISDDHHHGHHSRLSNEYGFCVCIQISQSCLFFYYFDVDTTTINITEASNSAVIRKFGMPTREIIMNLSYYWVSSSKNTLSASKNSSCIYFNVILCVLFFSLSLFSIRFELKNWKIKNYAEQMTI